MRLSVPQAIQRVRREALCCDLWDAVESGSLEGGETGSIRCRACAMLGVSLDRSGRARSLEEQHADHERVATEQGWTLGESYRDESVSASRYSRKTRDDFDRLICDLDRDEFNAEVLMIWRAAGAAAGSVSG